MPDTHATHEGQQRHADGRFATGERRATTSIYLEKSLRQRLERELMVRRTRDGATAWSLSAIVSDILAQHFGLSGFGQNGASDD